MVMAAGKNVDVDTLFRQASALQQAGELDKAAELCREGVAAAPQDIRFYNLLGILALLQGDADGCESILAQSLTIDPRQAQTLSNRAIALERLHRVDEALECVDAAIAIRPDYAQAYCNRGNFLNGLDRPEEALAACDKAIALGANFAAVFVNRGNALRTLMRLEEALAEFDRAVRLSPNTAIIHLDRGNVQKDLGQLEAAVESFNRAIALNPNLPDSYTCRGNAWRDLKEFDAAIADHDRALALKPDYESARWNKSLVALTQGNFAEGWPLFEARWHGSVLKRHARHFEKPLWLGDAPLSGKTVLLYAEQGLGDTVQFCRYVPMVAALGAKVVLEVPASLMPLMATLDGVSELVVHGAQLPDFDLQCPLMSLPLAFRTDLASVPAEIPYLRPDPARQAAWHVDLGEKRVPRVGLCWSGKAGQTPDLKRSMPASYLATLMKLPCEFHCLQKEIRKTDAVAISAWPQLHTHADELEDFADAAALISEMDLVLSVDTSVAHVAGALGLPLWVMLPWASEWRWLIDRTDSPWYPTATLFRQPARGDWDGLMSAVAAGLTSAIS